MIRIEAVTPAKRRLYDRETRAIRYTEVQTFVRSKIVIDKPGPIPKRRRSLWGSIAELFGRAGV